MQGLGTALDVAQRNLGIPVSSHWDAATLGALAPYQASGRGPLKMFAVGHPDPATLINLGYYDPIEELPKDQRDFLDGAAKPTTFWRDLATASNQVPMWAWIVLGVGLLGLGYVNWKNKDGKK
jgi:hypothetical protein